VQIKSNRGRLISTEVSRRLITRKKITTTMKRKGKKEGDRPEKDCPLRASSGRRTTGMEIIREKVSSLTMRTRERVKG